jgi:hypothetical protein
MTRNMLALPLLFAALGLGAGTACREADTRGAIMLAFNTDLSVPKDVKSVGLYITQAGNVLHFNRYPAVESGGQYLVRFPSTFAVVSNGSATAAPVRVKVVAYREDAMGQPDAFIMREAITRVPTDRTALLRMPLQYLSQGSLKTGTGVNTQSVRTLSREPTPDETILSTCSTPNTHLVDGECASSEIDSATLPTYDPKETFGGGSAPDDPSASCFAVEACLDRPFPVAIDQATCTSVERVADPANLNLALETTDGLGVCSNDQCRVVLDRVESNERGGWYLGSDGRAVLPKAVCAQFNKGNIRSVLATGRCASKDAKTPVCAAWTNPNAKATPVAKPDAPPPFSGDGGVPDGGPPGDSGVLDGSTMGVIENVGPGEPLPMALTIFNNRAFVVTKKGRVVSFDKEKPDMDGGSNVQVVFDEDPGGTGKEFGYTIAVSRTMDSQAIAVRCARTTGNAFAKVLPLGSTTWPMQLKPLRFAPRGSFGTPLYQTLGVASAAPYGFVVATKIVDGVGGPETYQPFKLASDDIETTGMPAALALNAMQETHPSEGAVGSDDKAVYFAVQSLAANATILSKYTIGFLQTAAQASPDDRKIATMPTTEGHRVYALSAGDPDYVYFISDFFGPPIASRLYRAKKDGSTPSPELVHTSMEPLVASELDVFNGVAADDDPRGWVYYTSSSKVWAVSKVSKMAIVISPTDVRPRAIVFDKDGANSYVYWTYLGSGGMNGGVRRIKALPPTP